MRAIGFEITCAIVSLMCSSVACARALPHWPYDKLIKESDLVVIVEPTGSESTDDQPADDGLRKLKELIKGQNTSFNVVHIIKGKAPGETIRMMHFRRKPNGMLPDNGPSLIKFDPKEHKQYLLFLKARKDGRYEPVSGQYDPDLSVRELSFPRTDLWDD